MDSNDELVTKTSNLSIKDISQFKVSESIFSLSKSDPSTVNEGVTKIVRHIIMCILGECMDELSILRSINLQNDLGPNPNKPLSYYSIEDRYMGQENHAECRINSADTTFDKLAKDINKLYVVLRYTSQQIKRYGRYGMLVDAILITNQMHSEEVQLLEDEEEKEKVIEDLKNLYEEERLENIRTIEETDAKIQKLRFQGEDIYIYGQHEVIYFDKWEKARVEQNELKCKEKENYYSSIIKDTNEKIRLEERCHFEFVSYLEESKNDDFDGIQYWMKRYDEDLEQREGDIITYKADLEKISEERKQLSEKYEERLTAINDWLEYQRIKEEKEQQRLKEIMAATQIQSWWRGVMVRKKLGPYRKKRKGKKGKNDKKGKKKKK